MNFAKFEELVFVPPYADEVQPYIDLCQDQVNVIKELLTENKIIPPIAKMIIEYAFHSLPLAWMKTPKQIPEALETDYHDLLRLFQLENFDNFQSWVRNQRQWNLGEPDLTLPVDEERRQLCLLVFHLLPRVKFTRAQVESG